MKRSNNQHTREKTAFLYERLSRDDNMEGDSYSIINQKKLLNKVAKEKGYTHLVDFVDDGISGVTMDRPGFKKMMAQLEAGVASAVFVKDLSRLGRNYIEVGRLTEGFFVDHDIRLVAVSDCIDTHEGENELAPIRNLFNEWYSRDISKKRRLSNKIKGNSGEPLGPPPYGYKKDPDNPKHWIIDEEAAVVVRRIFAAALDGYGTMQIASLLTKDGILSPTGYYESKGIKKPSKHKPSEPYQWSQSSVGNILSKQEYCGDVLNFKTYSKSYKNKKRYENDPENIVVFENVHEAIIDRTTWEKLQAKRGKTRKKACSSGEKNMFSGLLICADCGHNLQFHFNQANPDIKYFNCSGYNKGALKCCSSTHYIRVDFLEKVVLGEIRRITQFACHHEKEFSEAVGIYSKKVMEQLQNARESELKTMLQRDRELDNLFERLYEDCVSGKISDERFSKLSEKYEHEQSLLSQRIKDTYALITDSSAKANVADQFIAAVKKYTHVKKLTPRMLNELIDHIEVFQREKKNGVSTQKVVIHYNCIGSIEIPDIIPLSTPEVKIQTRKGVMINYEPGATSESAV